MDPITHASVVLDRDTDVVEFCPHSALTHLLAVGSYTLDDAGARDGCLYLFHTAEDEDSGSYTLTECTRRDKTDAVFDLQWAPESHPVNNVLTTDVPASMLAHAGTSGAVFLYRCTEDQLECLQEVKCSQEGGLCTSVAWSPPVTPGALLATSTSACELIVLDSAAPGGMTPIVHVPNAHDLETWMAAFDRWQPMLLFSGADDCAFKGWDLRITGLDEDSPEPALVQASCNRRAHTAGVCCIAPSPWEEHVVVTGSYDERVRLWDMRNLSRAVVTTDLKTGGGVWRLKWHPTKRGMLAAACMYNGFSLLEGATRGLEALTVTGEYTAHDNSTIAYGVDWSKQAHGEPSLLATCSFYERKVNLWSTDCKTSLSNGNNSGARAENSTL